MNVSSIVVKTAPERLSEAIAEINSINLCEVHFYDTDGQIIVTIEGERINDQMKTMKRIQDLPFVLSADLVYSYCKDESAEALEKIAGLKNMIPFKQ
jgi:nitrate reductase NapD